MLDLRLNNVPVNTETVRNRPVGKVNDLKGHPCFNPGDHHRFGRIHLPVAPRCNIKCGYCDRKLDCANETRPGTSSRVITPEEALLALQKALVEEPRIRVAAVAGPGDPLANEETFRTFELVSKTYSGMIKCLSTNGLFLPGKVDRLALLGLKALTVTLNAVHPEIGSRIYEWVDYEGERLTGYDAADRLIKNQLEGIKRAVELGISVKVNTVLIPGINDSHVEEIAQTVKELGVHLMNIMPLYPAASFKDFARPTASQLQEVRSTASGILPQMTWCRQCRADAYGLLSAETCLS
ncbi:MAG: radical SAM protein [Desulforudis sp.]|jgi:nitrogen fixation protein NifB|nr:radical SAM protein [Clostridia bacterium]MDQ7791348.1 radical SAM protein [Clostridia bacterium]RJX20647.1 MAG: radical SAM protein [Desulforudis sp.]